MGYSDEEIYVTFVVVRRPPGSAEVDIDPARWTDLILSGLVPVGSDHRAEVLTRRLSRQGSSRRWEPHLKVGLRQGDYGLGPGARPQGRPWIYFTLGAVCFSLAIYLTQFLLK